MPAAKKPETQSAAPKKPAAAKKSTKKEAAKEVPPAPVPPTPAEAAGVDASNGTDAMYAQMSTLLNQYDEQLKSLKTLAAELRRTMKALGKASKDELKQASKGKRAKKVKDPNAPKREPSGFAKPTSLSPELCAFLGLAEDTKVARTDVTKKVTEYIKEHNLQNPDNKREILPDAKLKALLDPPAGTTVTFFSLQTHMKKHFLKADAPEKDEVTKKPVALKKKATKA